jgi:hypothetical protein
VKIWDGKYRRKRGKEQSSDMEKQNAFIRLPGTDFQTT